MGLGAAGALGIEAAGSIATSATSGLFGANQARKNRAFQERMYYQQLKDNRENWEMVNKYNLPSAELQRIKDANLNPLLYYTGNAGSQAQPITGASAPHGAQATARFENPFAGFTQSLAQMRLLESQERLNEANAEKAEADAKKAASETTGIDIQNEINKATKNIQIAAKFNDNDLLAASIRKISSEIMNGAILTAAQWQDVMYGNYMLLKRYNLDEWSLGEQFKQKWKEIAIHQQEANTSRFNAQTNRLNYYVNRFSAITDRYLTDAQVGQIGFNVMKERRLLPYQINQYMLGNKGLLLDTMLKGVQIEGEKKKNFKLDLENYLDSHGAGKDTYLYKIAAPFLPVTFELSETIKHRNDYKLTTDPATKNWRLERK